MASCEKGQMPQRHNCSYAVFAQVQGEQASCEGDPTRLQAQGCPGVKVGHRITNDLSAWKIPVGAHGLLQTMAHWHHGCEERFPAERLHPSGGRDLW